MVNQNNQQSGAALPIVLLCLLALELGIISSANSLKNSLRWQGLFASSILFEDKLYKSDLKSEICQKRVDSAAGRTISRSLCIIKPLQQWLANGTPIRQHTTSRHTDFPIFNFNPTNIQSKLDCKSLTPANLKRSEKSIIAAKTCLQFDPAKNSRINGNLLLTQAVNFTGDQLIVIGQLNFAQVTLKDRAVILALGDITFEQLSCAGDLTLGSATGEIKVNKLANGCRITTAAWNGAVTPAHIWRGTKSRIPLKNQFSLAFGVFDE